jgi:hypothetical protein
MAHLTLPLSAPQVAQPIANLISFSFCGPRTHAMVVSAAQRAKRALVVLLRSIAAIYNVAVALTRDSTDAAALSAFRRVALRAHPDRGGDVRHQQVLNDARGDWQSAKASSSAGRPGPKAKSQAKAKGKAKAAPRNTTRAQAASAEQRKASGAS